MKVVLNEVPISSENPPNSITASWMISGLVLKSRKDKELGMA
jgi:hypothetical protein